MQIQIRLLFLERAEMQHLHEVCDARVPDPQKQSQGPQHQHHHAWKERHVCITAAESLRVI